MRPYSEDALEMKLLLEAGIVNAADVVNWVDSVLRSYPDYDDDLANVSLGARKTPKEMVSLLERLVDGREEWNAIRRVMARMYEVLQENPSRGHDFARVLEQFWVRHNYDVPDDMRFMAGIEDQFQLAEEGVLGTVEEATKSFIDNLSRFKERPNMNDEDFEELEKSIQQAGEIKKGQGEPGRVFKFSPNSAYSQHRLTFTPVTAEHIRQFIHWQYEPPYDVYNENPAELEAITDYYLDPQFQCQAMLDEAGEMVGLCSFGPDGQVPGGDYSREALDIGLAIRPDLTGRGQGSAFIEAVLDFGRRQYNPPAFRVTIAEFNKRAQRVWQKAGFEEVQRFGRASDNFPFIVFILPASPQ